MSRFLFPFASCARPSSSNDDEPTSPILSSQPPAYDDLFALGQQHDRATFLKKFGGSLSSSVAAGLTGDELKTFRDDFGKDPKNRLAQAAILRNDIREVLGNRNVLLSTQHTFNNALTLEGNITNQLSSGRCWLFAATNIMRLTIMQAYNLERFELSQSYLFFWDKLEKANFFLETMIQLLGVEGRDVDERTVQHLLKVPVNDGGQWDMIVNIVEKYGVVPKSVFPETYHSSNSSQLNWLVTRKLREDASILRRMIQVEGLAPTSEDVRATKMGMMNEIFRILCITLGEPPKEGQTFDWEFRNKDNKFFSFRNLTPKMFYETHIRNPASTAAISSSLSSLTLSLSSPTSSAQPIYGFDVSAMVSLVNDPRHPYYRAMTVDYLNNMVDGRPVTYINVPIEVMKDVSVKTIQSGRAVWFGCDVGKFFHKSNGVLDLNVYDYDLAFGITIGMSKAERLQYGESLMTHAMVFTGVHLDDGGKPLRWRVENSWGESSGEKGFEVMSDTWFNEYLYQVVVRFDDCPSNVKELVEETRRSGERVIRLSAWDPM
ncbi:hypothetical protein HK102_012529 [Quaeritorhiza haematococci]|nr:hypothetical protein HK102_012529 [Quaeritorhiza haematococci]